VRDLPLNGLHPRKLSKLFHQTTKQPALAEKRLTIAHVNPVLLFGIGDVHLRKLEAAFPGVQIIARGNQLILRGEAEALERIERTVRELIALLNRHGQLSEQDVDTVLALFTTGDGVGAAPAAINDVILYTTTGVPVRARTPNQRRLVEMARQNDIVFAIGPAGTGKTYTAVALAVAALKARQVKRIVLSRPAVEAGERLGFLPGDFREKVDPYLRPLYDALEDMLPRERLRTLIEQHVIEIVPLAYMRGRTLNAAFVILDEAQNATTQQMKMFLTRLGTNSRAIITGDITQTDLPSPEHSGLVEVQHVLEGVEGIAFVYFNREDVVRHRLVKDIIEAYERFAQREQNGGGTATAPKTD